MKKGRLCLLLAALLALPGCSFLLERSSSVVEPYTDRYWDSGEEDTLRAESYQDLVNSLLMLVEQRAEEGTVRVYVPGDEEAYAMAMRAKVEVREDTEEGAYLVERMTFTYTGGDGYSTFTYHIVYREGTDDPDALLTLSDTQSLGDLLRLSVREGHERITARFISDTSRSEVAAAVEALWQDLCRDKQEQQEPGVQSDHPEGQDSPETPPAEDGLSPAAEDPEGDGGTDETPPEAPAEELPPCPWEVRFYPDQEPAGIVEILLNSGVPAAAPEGPDVPENNS